MSEKINKADEKMSLTHTLEIPPETRSASANKSFSGSGGWRGYVAIFILVAVFAIAGLGASLFALYKQQGYNEALQQAAIMRAEKPVEKDVLKINALQNTVDAQSQELERQRKALGTLEGNQTKQQSALKEALDANNLSQAQLEQKLAQVQQSYLLPSSTLSQQMQQMYKQAVVLNLNFSKQAWQVLGSKTQTLLFLNQAKTMLMNVDQAGKWMPEMDSLIVQIKNLPSVEENFLRINAVQEGLLDLKILPPLSTISDERDHQITSTYKSDETGWRDALAQSWQQMKSLIQVQKIAPQDRVLLAQDGHIKLLSSLYNLLWQIKLGVINNNTKMIATLKQALIKTVEQYFVADDNAKKVINLISAVNEVPMAQIEQGVDRLISSLLVDKKVGETLPESPSKGDSI